MSSIIKDKLFYKSLKQIIFYINEYGIKKKNYTFSHQGDTLEFIKNVHHGFYLAQKDIIFLMQKVLTEKKRIKKLIIEANKVHDKDLKKEYDKHLENIRGKEYILRSCADSIGWVIMGQELSAVRRFYKFNEPIDILDSNFESVNSSMERLYQEFPLSFPLICDLTSIFQVGDIILIDYLNQNHKIIEVKDGKENEKIMELLHSFSENGCERYLYFSLDQENEKFKKQFSRFLKQQREMALTSNILNNDTGKEIIKGKERTVNLIEGNTPICLYDDILSELLKEVNNKNYSIRCIDECLLVGVYNNSKILMESAFDIWARSHEPEFPIWDSRMCFQTPLAKPIYLYNMSILDKMAVTTGKKSIKMCLIYDEWIKLLEKEGFVCELLTAKQTNKSISNFNKTDKPFLYDGRALQLTYNNFSMLLYDGILARIFTEHVRPTSAAKMLKTLIWDAKERFES
ncbi:hypothetical protein [Lacrimispora sp.]|uniref:hypothetical protein n=1 Tax=Lacrimispora sp. TaxID=2719234 RepID=UPI00289E4C8B|nr:hypothetical protein [Lacrimispora sp.]